MFNSSVKGATNNDYERVSENCTESINKLNQYMKITFLSFIGNSTLQLILMHVEGTMFMKNILLSAAICFTFVLDVLSQDVEILQSICKYTL